MPDCDPDCEGCECEYMRESVEWHEFGSTYLSETLIECNAPAGVECPPEAFN